MKFVKVVVAVILLGIAALFLIGVFVPEVDEHFEVSINRPIVGVYAGFVNLEACTDWIEDLQSIEYGTGILGMPGSTYKLVFADKETTTEYTMEILENIPLRSIKIRLQSSSASIDCSINLKPNGIMATDVEMYIRVKGTGIVSKAFVPLMKTVLMNDARLNLENFKRLLEQ